MCHVTRLNAQTEWYSQTLETITKTNEGHIQLFLSHNINFETTRYRNLDHSHRKRHRLSIRLMFENKKTFYISTFDEKRNIEIDSNFVFDVTINRRIIHIIPQTIWHDESERSSRKWRLFVAVMRL